MNIWTRITKLGRLKMKKEEEDIIFPQVQNMVAFFNHISQVPTEDVEPLISPMEDPLPFRGDEISEPFELLSQAPSLEGSFVKVPLVVKTDSKNELS